VTPREAFEHTALQPPVFDGAGLPPPPKGIPCCNDSMKCPFPVRNKPALFLYPLAHAVRLAVLALEAVLLVGVVVVDLVVLAAELASILSALIVELQARLIHLGELF